MWGGRGEGSGSFSSSLSEHMFHAISLSMMCGGSIIYIQRTCAINVSSCYLIGRGQRRGGVE